MSLDWTRKPRHQRHKSGQFFIVAYEDAPGQYYDEGGRPVSDDLAREAGFNVEEDRVELQKRRAIVKAREDAEQRAQQEIARIRAAQGPKLEGREQILLAEMTSDGTYRISDTHGNVVKAGVSFEEAFTAVALAHGFDDVAKQPLVEPDLDGRNKPTGKFRVVIGGKAVLEKASRGEAEALALQQVGGTTVLAKAAGG